MKLDTSCVFLLSSDNFIRRNKVEADIYFFFEKNSYSEIPFLRKKESYERSRAKENRTYDEIDSREIPLDSATRFMCHRDIETTQGELDSDRSSLVPSP